MQFDVHQNLFDRNGLPNEKKVESYCDQLVTLFEESPEGQQLMEENAGIGLVSAMMEYGINYFGRSPSALSPDDLSTILFEVFPAKVSTEPENAPWIIRRIRAFWSFMAREFDLENAKECLTILTDAAAQKLQRELSNPANFGMAKSIIMMGMERGFDMSTEEGIDEWMNTYKAELMASPPPRLSGPKRRSNKSKRAERKARQKSQRANRPKKKKKK